MYSIVAICYKKDLRRSQDSSADSSYCVVSKSLEGFEGHLPLHFIQVLSHQPLLKPIFHFAVFKLQQPCVPVVGTEDEAEVLKVEGGCNVRRHVLSDPLLGATAHAVWPTANIEHGHAHTVILQDKNCRSSRRDAARRSESLLLTFQQIQTLTESALLCIDECQISHRTQPVLSRHALWYGLFKIPFCFNATAFIVSNLIVGEAGPPL